MNKIYLDKCGYEIVGKIGHWNIYRPKGEIVGEEWWSENFGCDSHSLVINGGGHFEVEVIVLRQPERAVIDFLIDWGLRTYRDESESATKEYFKFFDDVIAQKYRKYLVDISPKFTFPGWGVEGYAELLELSLDDSIFPCPKKEDEIVESWLACSIGEFIYFDYNEICSDFVTELKQHTSYIDKRLWPNVVKFPI